MIPSFLHWRNLLALLAILIVTGTIFYSQYIARKIAADERRKVEQWVEASKSVAENPGSDLRLANLIRNEQIDIPIIETNENDSITSFVNLDTVKARQQPKYVTDQLRQFKAQNEPLQLILSRDPLIVNKYYYGDTQLLQEVRWYPLIQLLVVALFVALTIGFIHTQNRSTQNQVWAGMAKETAHQLGTPLSSLEGWMEILRGEAQPSPIIPELEKDIQRLKLVSDRFGKIGSKPQLEQQNVLQSVKHMVDYMRKRASDKVQFHIHDSGSDGYTALISPPLFDWVLENVLKNALDALEGKGKIDLYVSQLGDQIILDIQDTGKGMTAGQMKKVFKPGYTTKKRGWGLGLSLSKRIMETYHHGKITVKQSEPGKGTTFRMVLPAVLPA
jgi:signal transduction histidine kinase